MLRNEVRLFGYLSNDPIWIKNTKTPALRLYIAHNRHFKDKETEEWRQKTSFIPVICWNKTRADYIYQNIQKGDLVGISGELWYESQEKPVGSGKYINFINVSCDEIWLISKTSTKESRVKVPNFKTHNVPEIDPKLVQDQMDDVPEFDYDDHFNPDYLIPQTEPITTLTDNDNNEINELPIQKENDYEKLATAKKSRKKAGV